MAETLGLLQAGLSLLCGGERAKATAFHRRDVWGPSSSRVPQMSMPLASGQDSEEEPSMVFAELRVWRMSVLQWLGQKDSRGVGLGFGGEGRAAS